MSKAVQNLDKWVAILSTGSQMLTACLVFTATTAVGTTHNPSFITKQGDNCSLLLSQLKASVDIEDSNLTQKTLRDAYVWWMSQPDEDSSLPERRLKFGNAPGKGQSEMADPVREIPIEGPDGQTTWRVYSSGGREIQAHDHDALYRGGTKSRNSRKIEGYIIRRANGTESNIGSYHTGDFSWDMLVVTENIVDPKSGKKIQKQVGYAGMMALRQDQVRPPNFNQLPEYADPGSHTYRKYELVTEEVNGRSTQVFVDHGLVDISAVPTIADNHTRSRRAFDISYEKDANGKWREVWTEKGPVFPGSPTAGVSWINGLFRHGYGGRPIIDESGQPWRDEFGYKWIVFEAVTEQKAIYNNRTVLINGSPQTVLEKKLIPYKTEVLGQRMKDDYKAFVPGEKMSNGQEGFKEILLSSVASSEKAKSLSNLDYYPATVRDYEGSEPAWFLREGGANLAVIKVEGKKFWVKSESPGNFTSDNYNVILSYRSYESGPIGPFEDIITSKGDLQRFFSDLKELGISWGFGRADFTLDNSGRSWLRGHGILKNDLPSNYPISGWPSYEQFPQYFRRQILLPVRWSLVNGQPIPEMEPLSLPADVIQKYLDQKHHSGPPRKPRG